MGLRTNRTLVNTKLDLRGFAPVPSSELSARHDTGFSAFLKGPGNPDGGKPASISTRAGRWL